MRRAPLVKCMFSQMYLKRKHHFRAKFRDPAKQWTLSPIGLESQKRWTDYSMPWDVLLSLTDIRQRGLYAIDSDVGNHTWLDRISHLLSSVPDKRIKRDRIAVDKQTASVQQCHVFSISFEATRPRIVQNQRVRSPLDHLWRALLVFHNVRTCRG